MYWWIKESDHLGELFGHKDVRLGAGQHVIYVFVSDTHRQRSGTLHLGQAEIRAGR
jgi:hypothetical protein